MKQKFKSEVQFLNAEELTTENSVFTVETSRTHGIKSHELYLSIILKDQDPDTDFNPFVFVGLNRNEARYLSNFINAFLDEEELQTDFKIRVNKRRTPI